jgi:DNA modification methylase
MYTKPKDTVFDPFLGVGSTLLAARNLQRNGIGIELYAKFAKISKGLLKQSTLFEESVQTVIKDDCRNLEEHIKPRQIQLTFTSPPYANFIQRSVKDRIARQRAKNPKWTSRLISHNKSVVKQYGTNSNDFGNLEYEKFLVDAEELMEKIYRVTKPGGYNVWVVKDHRDPQNGLPYIPIHYDIGKRGEKAGFKFHDLIVWDQNDQRSLVLLGYPTIFYVNINHTFLVVLHKPKIKRKKK